MQTIWKFPFELRSEFTLELPKGSRILTFQMQGGNPCIWAVCDPQDPVEPRNFLLLGTGHPCSDLSKKPRYVGSAQDGPLVWHLFEKEGS